MAYGLNFHFSRCCHHTLSILAIEKEDYNNYYAVLMWTALRPEKRKYNYYNMFKTFVWCMVKSQI